MLTNVKITDLTNASSRAGLAALLLLVCFASRAFAATEMLDQVVAIVDDDVVMASELRDRITQLTTTLQARGMDMPPEDEMIRETLDRLILESIQMQMGNRYGVRISDAQLDGAMARVAAQNRLNLDQFRAALEQEGQSYGAMRENLRREMIIQRVQSGNVNQLIQITDQEIDNYLSTEEGQKLIQPEYRIVQALLPVSGDASAAEEEAARVYAQARLDRIRAGEPFEAVMSDTSSEYAFTGGDLGWRRLDDLPSIFQDIAPTLKAGETADLLRSPSGFHIVNMNNRRGADEVNVNQTKIRHILIKPSEILSEDEARVLAAELKVRIEGGEDFATLAREYSEDIGTAAEGGELGWTNPGQMVPEFENAADSAEIGAVTDPIKTQFGWHILEVMDRREKDMTNEMRRAQIGEHLHQRKYQEELDAWLRKIRDEAFVDIK